jgi:hypothetical protein
MRNNWAELSWSRALFEDLTISQFFKISQNFAIFETSLSYSEEHVTEDHSEPDESIKISVF